MKKGKVFGKRQIVMSLLVVCLAAAVWLNMRFSSLENGVLEQSDNSSSLSDNQFLSDSNLGVAVQTSAAADEIRNSREQRNTVRQRMLDDLKALLDSVDADETSKKETLKRYTEISDWSQKEVAAETVIKAKGYEDALVMISEENVTVIVAADTLLTSQTLQIQDAVTSQIAVDLEKIKIITVK